MLSLNLVTMSFLSLGQLMAKNPQYQEAKWALVIDDMFYAAEHVLQLPEDEEEVANGVYVKGKIGSKRQVKGLIYGREVIVSILDKGPEDVIKRLVKFGNGLLAEREKQLQTVLVSRISDDDTEEELPPQKKRKTDPIKSNDEDEDDEVFGDEKALKDSENFGGTLEDSQNESQDGTLDSLPEPKLRKPSDSEIPVGMENQVEYWKKKAEERKIEILKLNHDVKKLEFENNMMRKTQYEWMDKNVENKLKNFNFYDRKEWNNLMKEEILGNQNARKSFAVAACITAVIHFNSVSTNKYYLPLGTRGNDKTKKRNKRFYPDHETYWSLWMYILGKKELIKDRKRIMVNAVNHMDDASHFELRKKVKMLVGITATQIVVTDDIPDTPKKIRPEFRNGKLKSMNMKDASNESEPCLQMKRQKKGSIRKWFLRTAWLRKLMSKKMQMTVMARMKEME